MTRTRHFRKRANQRGIRHSLVDTVLRYGHSDRGNKVILGKRDAHQIIKQLDAHRRNLMKIADKGGMTVVSVNDRLITAYRY